MMDFVCGFNFFVNQSMTLSEIPSLAVFKDGSYFTYDGEYSKGPILSLHLSLSIQMCVPYIQMRCMTVLKGPYFTTRCEVGSVIESHFGAFCDITRGNCHNMRHVKKN